MMRMMMMMMMMNCLCRIIVRQNTFSLIFCQGHYQRFSPSQFSDTPWAGLEPALSQSLDVIEWSCAVVITTTPQQLVEKRLMVYLIHHIGKNNIIRKYLAIFSHETSSPVTVLLLFAYSVSTNLFFWTLFLWFFFRLFYSLIRLFRLWSSTQLNLLYHALSCFWISIIFRKL